MARLPRVDLPTIPLHIIQRGNNKSICFSSVQDYQIYLRWLEEYSIKYQVDIHAWVLMTNHVHILCTPQKKKAVTDMMQSLGRRYVLYFNKKYGRSGTLWEGRYKACLIEQETYLLQVYKYIELNPVRAGMVKNPGEYIWSSYSINAQGGNNKMCTKHPIYMALGRTEQCRYQAYKALFLGCDNDSLINEIRKSTNKCLAFGSGKFKKKIELLSGRKIIEGKAGRPRGSRS